MNGSDAIAHLIGTISIWERRLPSSTGTSKASFALQSTTAWFRPQTETDYAKFDSGDGHQISGRNLLDIIQELNEPFVRCSTRHINSR